MSSEPWHPTETHGEPPATGIGVVGDTFVYPRFGVRVIGGRDAGRVCEALGPELAIGSAAGNDLELSDPTVSRHHCAIRVTDRGFTLRDLGSTNGVSVGGIRIESAFLRAGSALRLGATRVRFDVLVGERREPLAAQTRVGRLHGRSAAMRRLFARLPAIAATESPVLIEGPAGSGKSALARAIHEHSRFAGGPLVVIDCAGFPPGRLGPRSIGNALGGTLLIEELGELDQRGQRELLFLLVGSAVDLRVIATSARDIRFDVNRGWFSPELYARFHHARVPLSPLSERRDDVPLLIGALYRELAGNPDAEPPRELIACLARRPWAGNLRELKGAVASALAARWPG
ncbi:MAG TPA: sigma 54-interacting transcriptional regulator [Kofleriaceae bacterium]|nr:sigma 54-interacting transcriptional regulator [Kofleriaceae bacterium]